MIPRAPFPSAARHLAIAALATGGLATAAPAEEEGAGRQEFVNSCATCHGMDGTGGGPMSQLLIIAAPDLTGLRAANDGVFPLREVIYVIDGRTGVRGHGTDSNMPVWGASYKQPLVDEIGPYASEIVVRGRILALAEYLETIQR